MIERYVEMVSKILFIFLIGMITLMKVDFIKNRVKNAVRYKLSNLVSAFYIMRY